MKKILLAMSCGLLFLSSCKKDSTPTKKDHLTTGNWKMTAATATTPMGPMDLLQMMQPCSTDNTFSFQKDSKLVEDEGASKCNSSDPQSTELGEWKLLNNDSQIQIPGILTTGGTITADILQLDENVMNLTYDTTYSGFSVTANISFMHNK